LSDGSGTSSTELNDESLMRLTPEEQRIIDFVERTNGGRKLTPQEINLSLEQARALGELQ
jgi:hypothetical protein